MAKKITPKTTKAPQTKNVKPDQLRIKFVRNTTPHESSETFKKDQTLLCDEGRASRWVRRGAAVIHNSIPDESENPNGKDKTPTPAPGSSNPGNNPDSGNDGQ